MEVISNVSAQRSAVRSIAFHEKAFKLKMKFHFIVVGCALGSGFHADSVWWSKFRSNLAQKGLERCHLVIEVFMLPRDASQSFRIVCPRLFAQVRKGLIVTAGFSTGLRAERPVCVPLPRPPVSWPARCHRPPTSIHMNAERSGDQMVPGCIARR